MSPEEQPIVLIVMPAGAQPPEDVEAARRSATSQTHTSTIDADALLAHKGNGKEAKLS
jgi:hypothetical protein